MEGTRVLIGGPRLLTEAKVTVPAGTRKTDTPHGLGREDSSLCVAQGRCSELSQLKMRFGLNPRSRRRTASRLESGLR